MHDFLKLNAKLKKQIINNQAIEQCNTFIQLAAKIKKICNTILTDPSIKKGLKNGSLEKYHSLIEKCNKNILQLKKIHAHICLSMTTTMITHYELLQNSM